MLKYFGRVIISEAFKQHKNYFHSKIIYFTMLLWPILLFLTAYYTYKPFRLEAATKHISYLNEENLITFILIGYVAQMFFRSFVQSAWFFSFERIYGTLELIYLSPANRLALVFGNSLSSLLQNVWLFVVFSVGVVVVLKNILFPGLLMSLIGVLSLIIPSIMWGGLLNSLFLFSRDTRILFTILEEPMELFGGVKIPVSIFPLWAKGLSYIFPLTYSIKILRRIFLKGESLTELMPILSFVLCLSLFMLMLTIILLKLGEVYAKKTGNMALF
ncbi:ABC transporter permease [Wukongibacter sp. M2B1]|uniref:ABC transporter permease n=1 Tax=Wukongibacter sp. M2B1 TaxID=3088895 RepID=UPI003D7B93C4